MAGTRPVAAASLVRCRLQLPTPCAPPPLAGSTFDLSALQPAMTLDAVIAEVAVGRRGSMDPAASGSLQVRCGEGWGLRL